jgi:hypothetical protein
MTRSFSSSFTAIITLISMDYVLRLIVFVRLLLGVSWFYAVFGQLPILRSLKDEVVAELDVEDCIHPIART